MKKEADFDVFKNYRNKITETGCESTLGEQASSALIRLKYEWFSEGGLYDNQNIKTVWNDKDNNKINIKNYWMNDVSGSANWLYNYIKETRNILEKIFEIDTEEKYIDLLYDLFEIVDPLIPELSEQKSKGNCYKEKGVFKIKNTFLGVLYN